MIAGQAEWITENIRRVLAPNPSPMTGPGTNSYLIGRGGDLVLVDPGPMIDAHLDALRASLTAGERIAVIVVTHPHLDHSQSARALSGATGAPVCAFAAAGEARSPLMQRLATEGVTGGGEGIDHSFRPDRRLRDLQVLSGDWGDLVVRHTPGHMSEHLCLGLGTVLFSGDHAMGWSTSLVSPPDGDMGAYMASLQRLMHHDWTLMLPGHGAAVIDVADRLTALRDHRLMRESAIRAQLRNGPVSARKLAPLLYTDTPAALLPAAARNILAHLIDLTDRNLITPNGKIGPDTEFSCVSQEV